MCVVEDPWWLALHRRAAVTERDFHVPMLSIRGRRVARGRRGFPQIPSPWNTV